jgi:hypothetical protein
MSLKSGFPTPNSLRLSAPLSLLLVGWLVLFVGLVVDTRRSGPEPMLRGYLSDLQDQRVDKALTALTPAAADQWHDFLEFQQFNRYQVVSIAVRSPSVLESLSQGAPWRPTQATMVADILEPSGVRWRGSTIVPLTYVDGRWSMTRPPFAND